MEGPVPGDMAEAACFRGFDEGPALAASLSPPAGDIAAPLRLSLLAVLSKLERWDAELSTLSPPLLLPLLLLLSSKIQSGTGSRGSLRIDEGAMTWGAFSDPHNEACEGGSESWNLTLRN